MATKTEKLLKMMADMQYLTETEDELTRLIRQTEDGGEELSPEELDQYVAAGQGDYGQFLRRVRGTDK